MWGWSVLKSVISWPHSGLTSPCSPLPIRRDACGSKPVTALRANKPNIQYRVNHRRARLLILWLYKNLIGASFHVINTGRNISWNWAIDQQSSCYVLPYLEIIFSNLPYYVTFQVHLSVPCCMPIVNNIAKVSDIQYTSKYAAWLSVCNQ